ncbi:MAG TPA: pyrroloquinoline quinone biosynthesis peptide chaperone PqqD [Candidatus Baltobacteraceae bacterium]|nr:pyrroloquinoline quinone biosynthesis peptide chaperone PqqD [Candidatus Baltobacteraceae bacterium]
MNAVRPSFAKGVRFRETAEGAAMLLIPEGVLMLNGSAAATLALVDGQRSIDDIVDALTAAYDVPPEQARAEVTELFERLALRQFLTL